MPRNPKKQRCARAGCRAWAMSDSPFCRAHRHPETRPDEPLPPAPVSSVEPSPLGIYASALTPEEQRLVQQDGRRLDLEPEIWLLRLMSRRLFEAIGQEGTDLETVRKLATVLYQGIARVAQVIRVQRTLQGDAADGLAGALAKAIDEIDEL
jgi:hypothetical protein